MDNQMTYTWRGALDGVRSSVAIALGAAAYVQKPIDQPRLLGVLAPFLAAPSRGSVGVG